MWFLARLYDAQQALQMGLVNTVVPLARLEEETTVWWAPSRRVHSQIHHVPGCTSPVDRIVEKVTMPTVQVPGNHAQQSNSAARPEGSTERSRGWAGRHSGGACAVGSCVPVPDVPSS